MTAPTPKPGERWRFIPKTTEGVVDRVEPRAASNLIWITTSTGSNQGIPSHLAGEWMLIEPLWEIGDVARDATGRAYEYMTQWGSAAWRDFSGSVTRDEYMVRPLTRLVPEVTS